MFYGENNNRCVGIIGHPLALSDILCQIQINALPYSVAR